MATILTPDDLPNNRTDCRACDESYAGGQSRLARDVTKLRTSWMGGGYVALPPIADMARRQGRSVLCLPQKR